MHDCEGLEPASWESHTVVNLTPGTQPSSHQKEPRKSPLWIWQQGEENAHYELHSEWSLQQRQLSRRKDLIESQPTWGTDAYPRLDC